MVTHVSHLECLVVPPRQGSWENCPSLPTWRWVWPQGWPRCYGAYPSCVEARTVVLCPFVPSALVTSRAPEGDCSTHQYCKWQITETCSTCLPQPTSSAHVVRVGNKTRCFKPLRCRCYLLLQDNLVYPDRYKLLHVFHLIDREIKPTFITFNHSGLNLLMAPHQPQVRTQIS